MIENKIHFRGRRGDIQELYRLELLGIALGFMTTYELIQGEKDTTRWELSLSVASYSFGLQLKKKECF